MTSASKIALLAASSTIAITGALAALGCGGSSPPAKSTESAPKAAAPFDTPAEKCLAIAGGKRARKPDEPAKVSVKHVLVKYAGAKQAAATVTRSREDACLRAQEARSKLESGTPFAEVVSTYSEEAGAASREGSLGAIQRTDVVPPFADAAFELGPGEVSYVVETPFGFHVIQRTE